MAIRDMDVAAEIISIPWSDNSATSWVNSSSFSAVHISRIDPHHFHAGGTTQIGGMRRGAIAAATRHRSGSPRSSVTIL
jgi:hypothetical protein